MNIAFIGTGNVAWHLTQGLEQVGHQVVSVYSRHSDHAATLCKQLYDAQIKYDLDFTETNADIVLVAVADDALAQVIDSLILSDEIIVAHTSGSKPMQIFEDYPYHCGVFYPLQTFSKQHPLNLSKVPFCIEASSNRIEDILLQLAKSLSDRVYLINSRERSILHIAAVFACNFVNHLFVQSKDILDQAGIDFDILKPLIQETVRKALQTDPKMVQTGPAIRNDRQIIEQHLAYLQKSDVDKRRIYQLLTESILNF
ncbi:MAG: Rossmann-like and DUF2520 domain-containing protein [Bacteroidota bacterium]